MRWVDVGLVTLLVALALLVPLGQVALAGTGGSLLNRVALLVSSLAIAVAAGAGVVAVLRRRRDRERP